MATYQVMVAVKVTAPPKHVRAVTKFVHGLARKLLVGESTGDIGEIEVVGASVENDAVEVNE